MIFENPYNQGEWPILYDILNKWVTSGVASDPHDFMTAAQSKRLGEYVQGLTPLSRFSVLQSQ